MTQDQADQYQRIPFQITHGFLVASLQGYLDDSVLNIFQVELLSEIKQSQVRGVVLDMSNVSLLDSLSFTTLKKIADSISMLGAKTVFTGFQPTVISALVAFDIDFSGIDATLQLEEAFNSLNSLSPKNKIGDEIESI